MRARVGWEGGGGEWGGGILTSCPMGWTRDPGTVLKAESKIPVSREQKATQILLEVMSRDRQLVNFCAEFWPQGRILRAADFLFLITNPGAEATDFSAHISQFSFLSSNSQPGLEFGRPDISHFSILNANPRTPTAWRSHNSSFRLHGSQFWFQKGPCRSQTRRLLVSHFAFLVSKEASVHGI